MTRKYKIFITIAIVYALIWFGIKTTGSVGEATNFLNILVEAGVVEKSSTGMCTTEMPSTCYDKISLSPIFQPKIFTVAFLFGVSVLVDWVYTFLTSSKLSWDSEHTLYSILIASYLTWILYTDFNATLELVLGGFAVIGIGAIIVDAYEILRYSLTNKH